MARLQPTAAATSFGEQTLTWAHYRQRISRLAGALHTSEVGAGDRVAVANGGFYLPDWEP